MKKNYFFIAIFLLAISVQVAAQAVVPKGFIKGAVTLPDSTVVAGYVKDNMRSNATIILITAADNNKKNYTASELLAVAIDSLRFICIKGDFFRLICDGTVSFLQKSGNASAKPVYNGTEAIFVKGTEGQVNDYFFYNKELLPVLFW